MHREKLMKKIEQNIHKMWDKVVTYVSLDYWKEKERKERKKCLK